MSEPAPARVSVIVATRNRCSLLDRMLQSLDRAIERLEAPAEVVVADNGSTDATARVLATWQGHGPGRHVVTVEQPGKARALNVAIARSTAPLLAFTDDDVEVDPNWLRHIVHCFDSHPAHQASMGRVLLPRAVVAPEILARIAYYRTLPLYDQGDDGRDGRHLYGCNMALRRAVFDRIGQFNEALGPGASGLHEDGDLARRVLAAGFRIIYAPDIIVRHAVDESRLTFESFQDQHRRDGRSRFVMDPPRHVVQPLAHWLGALVVFAAWSLLRNPQRAMRARGRLISHAERVRCCRHTASGQQPG